MAMPCGSWITDPADLGDACLPTEQDDVAARALVDRWGPVATLILWAATGRQYPGVCTDKVWPNVGDGRCGIQWLSYGDGTGRPIATDPLRPDCSRDHTAILLPHRPVRQVTDVTIGGVTVDPSTYRLKDRRWLVRCDAQVWPCWQDVCDDFTVTYDWGVPAPAGGSIMAGRVVCELGRAAAGCECRLPSRAQTVAQEGVTTAVLLGDPLALLDAGATNIPEVDLWVKALNPNRIDRAAKMLTPPDLVEQTHRLR